MCLFCTMMLWVAGLISLPTHRLLSTTNISSSDPWSGREATTAAWIWVAHRSTLISIEVTIPSSLHGLVHYIREVGALGRAIKSR